MSSDDKNTPENKNGDNKDSDKKTADILHFPSLAERDKKRREQRELEQKKAAEEALWRKQYRAQGKSSYSYPPNNAQNVPFFNFGHIPPFTKYFTAAMIAIHLITTFLINDVVLHDLYMTFGFVPLHFTADWKWFAPITTLSYALLHSGWLHIGFNSVMMLALGKFYEREFGTRAMLTLFTLCAVGGAALHLAASPYSAQPVVGASGAISGLFAVMLVLFYRRGMMGPAGKYGMWPLLGIWVVLMLFMGLAGGPNTAWLVHMGGFFTGLFTLSYKLRRDFYFWKL